MPPSTPTSDLREDIHRVEDAVADLRDRVARHEGQDEERHDAQMGAIRDVKTDVGRLGDAVRELTGKLASPGGLTEKPSGGSSEGVVTVKGRLPAPPSIATAGRWGLVLLAVAGPTALTVAGAVYAIPPAQVQAAIHAMQQQASPPAPTLRVDNAVTAPTPLPPPTHVQPVQPQE